MNEIKTKVCTRCEIQKNMSDFGVKTTSPVIKFSARCRDCINKEARDNHLKRRQKYFASLPAEEPKTTKICSKCDKEKDFYLFRKQSSTKTGFSSACRECLLLDYQANRPRHLASNKRNWAKNKQNFKASIRRYRENNKEKIQEMQRSRSQRPEVKERNNFLARERNKKRKKTDQYRISQCLRHRLFMTLKRAGAVKISKTFDLLGCSFDFFKSHLESKFLPGMTWENRGKFTWHIDHIIPVSKFNLVDPEEQKKCFHHTNLAPRWATTRIAREYSSNQIGNINKSSKILSEEQILAERIPLDFDLPLI